MILRSLFFILGTDFDDSFGGDPEPDPSLAYVNWHLHILVPAVLAILVVLLSWWIAHTLGVRSARRRVREAKKRAARDIYDVVRKKLDIALATNGAAQIERVKELHDVLKSRLDHVLSLRAMYGPRLEELETALSSDSGKIVTGKATPAKIQVAKGTEEHRVAVWKSLKGFKIFWDDEASVMKLIENAQSELLCENSNERFNFIEKYLLAQQNASIAASTQPSVEAVTGAPPSPPVPKSSSRDDEPPPPPPPPPSPPPKGKLPVHKRNMLA